MKKLILVALIIFMMLSCTAFADDAVLIQSHIDDLYKLGIMVGDEDGNLRLGDTITRAEAAKMICISAGLSTEQLGDDAGFPDVANSHWAYGYICALKENGIVNGDENGNFNPEDKISNEEIVKIIVGILGYSPMAEQRGGYPAGFNAVASVYGLTEGFSFETNTHAIRQDVAIMISRALDTPIMAEVQKPDAYEYKILDGTNGTVRTTLRDGIKSADVSE